MLRVDCLATEDEDGAANLLNTDYVFLASVLDTRLRQQIKLTELNSLSQSTPTSSNVSPEYDQTRCRLPFTRC